MFFPRPSIWLLPLLGLFVRCSVADVIYSNLTSALTDSGLDVIGSAASAELGLHASYNAGQLFNATGDFALTKITVGASYFSGPTDPQVTSSPNFDMWLYSDVQYTQIVHNHVYVSHEPNLPLAELAENLIAPSDPTLVSTAAPPSVQLTSGNLYWILLTPANPYTLITYDATLNGPAALEVDGTIVTPEPLTLGLCGFVLVGMSVAGSIRLKEASSGGSEPLTCGR